MTAKELREKRAELAKEIRKLADQANANGGKLDAAAEENWKKVNADYDALAGQLERAERAETVEAEQRRTIVDPGDLPGRENRDPSKDENRDNGGAGGDDEEMTDQELGINVRNVKPEVFALAMQGWMRYQAGFDIEERHAKAARIAGVQIRRRNLDLTISDTRQYRNIAAQVRRAKETRTALSAIDLSAGASTIAPEFANNFERALLAFGGMREVSDVIRTNTGAQMPWPTANDTGNEGHQVGENVAATNTGVSTGAVTFSAYKFTSDLILVPAELLEDSAFDLVSIVSEMAGERVARATNRKYTTGSGAGTANGVITAATLGVTAASATAIAADELIGLVHSVDPLYRNMPGSGFMFHDNTLLALRKLKDGNGQYLWVSGMASAQPDRLYGFPYTINQHMASSIATTQKTVLFGALNKYKIRDVRQLRMRRLVERYADQDQEAFVAFFRTDGNLLDAGTHPVKYLAQA